MAESFTYRIIKIFFIIFLLVFIITFLKSGYYKAVIVDHDLTLARKCADKFMLFLTRQDLDKAYNLFYAPAKEQGKREPFKENINSAFEHIGEMREILFMASYPQTNGPYLGLHYKALHEKVRSVDYYFLLIKEETGYSVFEFVYGESGTFYPDFSFKREIKQKPAVIYKK